jgi:hypothetical protein
VNKIALLISIYMIDSGPSKKHLAIVGSTVCLADLGHMQRIGTAREYSYSFLVQAHLKTRSNRTLQPQSPRDKIRDLAGGGTVRNIYMLSHIAHSVSDQHLTPNELHVVKPNQDLSLHGEL